MRIGGQQNRRIKGEEERVIGGLENGIVINRIRSSGGFSSRNRKSARFISKA